MATYEANALLDHKQVGCHSLSDAAGIIRSHLWHNIVYKIIGEDDGLPVGTAHQMLKHYSECADSLYTGQYHDVLDLTFDSAGKLSGPHFMKLYEERCEQLGASTLSPCALSATLRNCEQPILNILDSILCKIGTAGQIINDLGDFLIRSQQVKHKDNFADLRNRRLTLPYYILYQNGYDLESLRERVLSPDVDAGFLARIFRDENLSRIVLDFIRAVVHDDLFRQIEQLSSRCNQSVLHHLYGVASMPYHCKIVRALGVV